MRTTLLTYLLLFVSILSFGQRKYVNQAATGTNDGSSWTNAFKNLEDALSSDASELWIAKGSYKPAALNPQTASYTIKKNTKLYGGFAGTEANLSDRNLTANAVILTGDLLGNDLATDLSKNREDNAIHVIYVDSTVAEITLDGFTISGGNTKNDPMKAEEFWRGGGVFSYSKLIVKNCTFKENFGRSGTCIYISPVGPNNGDNSLFENNVFSNNTSTAQSAGIHFALLNDVKVINCSFINNNTVRGAFYPFRSNNVSLSKCKFENNKTANDGFGGAFFVWNCLSLKLTECEFKGNSGGNGAAIYVDGREFTQSSNPNASLNLINCKFLENEALDFGGGAIYNFESPLSIDSCEFNKNRSANSGAHVFNNVNRKAVEIKNTTFRGGEATFGAAHTCYGTSKYTLKNNDYESGVASTSGGAMIVGFLANASVENCTFTQNKANFGGAIYTQNDTTVLSVKASSFLVNTSVNQGGAIMNGGGPQVLLDGCTFQFNQSNFGGAYSTFDSGLLSSSIKNCIFESNVSASQGGAVNIFAGELEIVSSTFLENINNGVAGGAISLNAGDSTTSKLTLINSSFFNNASPKGNCIGQFQSEVVSSCELVLQNNVFVSEGLNYEVEEGNPSVKSNGGNLSNDASMQAFLNGPNDKNSVTHPIFNDGPGFDLTLPQGSPAIDNGIASGAPSVDINGKPRLGPADAGAYESDFTGYSDLSPSVKLSLFPIPARDRITISLEEDAISKTSIQIFDETGKSFYKASHDQKEVSVDISLLNEGLYIMHIMTDKGAATAKFFKVK